MQPRARCANSATPCTGPPHSTCWARSTCSSDVEPAHPRLNESLSIYTELADERSVAECSVPLGGYAAATDNPEDAARLWGAADRLRGNSPLEYAEPAIDAHFRPGLSTLGEQRYEELGLKGARPVSRARPAGLLASE